METMTRRAAGEAGRIRRDLEDLWNRYLGEPLFRRLGIQEWTLYVDVSETDEDVVVRAELPGLDAKEIDVHVSDDTLTIRGEKRTEKEAKEERPYTSERYFGPFERVVRLPARIQEDKVDAQFKNGVLRIRMAKVEKAKRKKIDIRGAE